MSRRQLGLLLLLATVAAAVDASPITTTTISGAEVIVVVIPAGWSSLIVSAAERERFAALPERVLINGGYFDAQGRPDALLIQGSSRSGTLRHDPPYSGFVWGDAAGSVHILHATDPPPGAAWAIQTGPVLVEQGRSGINATTSVAPRSLIALRHGQALAIRSGRIGLKELADGLVEAGIEIAINLDGGPSSALQARMAGGSEDRAGTARVPYFLGFQPRKP